MTRSGGTDRGTALIRQVHGGTVELQVPATLVKELTAEPPPGGNR